MACATGAFQQCPRCEHTAVCKGPRNGNAGRVADRPHDPEVADDEPDRNTRRRTPSVERPWPKTLDRARFCGYSFVDFNVIKAWCRHCGATERADLPIPMAFRARGGSAPRRRNRAGGRSETVESRRTKTFSGPPANYDRYIYIVQ